MPKQSQHLKYKKFLERYHVGQVVHIVDFKSSDGKSYIGKIVSVTNQLLICQLDKGYKISISFAELKCSRFGINVCT